MNGEYAFQKARRCSATSMRTRGAMQGSHRSRLDRLPLPRSAGWRSRR